MKLSDSVFSCDKKRIIYFITLPFTSQFDINRQDMVYGADALRMTFWGIKRILENVFFSYVPEMSDLEYTVLYPLGLHDIGNN